MLWHLYSSNLRKTRQYNPEIQWLAFQQSHLGFGQTKVQAFRMHTFVVLPKIINNHPILLT